MTEKAVGIDAKAYWTAVIRLTVSLLVVWFAVSFGAGILLRGWLDQFRIGGAPLGFWFAQQGSIYVFVGLIFYYCTAMRRLERKFGIKG
jgi:putative solute:sodium symporter small subunit